MTSSKLITANQHLTDIMDETDSQERSNPSNCSTDNE